MCCFMLDALDRKKISSLERQNAADIGEAIESSENDKARVLVLDLNDVPASGANLTVANHVIVVSPLLEEDVYVYNAIMRQAHGR